MTEWKDAQFLGEAGGFLFIDLLVSAADLALPLAVACGRFVVSSFRNTRESRRQ
jgi:hypothetical protein